MCARHGADVVGFVALYPHPVSWNLDLKTAKELVAAVGGATKTCIVTGGMPEKIVRLAREAKPDLIQLHCGETLEDTAYLVRELEKDGVKIIKTLFPNTPDLEKTAAAFCAAGVHALLFDPRTPSSPAHGGAADLEVFDALRRAVDCPVILAGGITPENVAEIVRKSGARGIDLMTGVEICPGMKDESKVIALFQALRAI